MSAASNNTVKKDVKTESSISIEAIVHELQNLDSSAFPALHALAENGGIAESLDLISNRNVKVRAKVDLPQSEFPGVNFVGKLLGPKGCTLRALQESTQTKMAVLGAGSLRDDSKEKELLSNGDPKYQHLKQKIHLQIDCLGGPIEAYYRLAHALCEDNIDISKMHQHPPMPPQQAPPPWFGQNQMPVPPPGQLQSPRPPAPFRSVRPNPRMSGQGNDGLPSGSPGNAFRGRGKPWIRNPPPTNGFNHAQPTMSAIPDNFNNDPNPDNFPAMTSFDQPEFNGSSYEELGLNYGQNDNWGKIGMPDNRGRGRGHPYARGGL